MADSEPTPVWKLIVVRVVVWVLFGVVFGLLPLIISIIKDAASAEGLHLSSVLGKGELLMIGAVIAAGSLGELLATWLRASDGMGTKVLRILTGFTVLAAFTGNTILYVYAGSLSPSAIANLSLIFFSVTVIGSTVAVGTAAGT
jgi:hypothetical protein